MNRVGRDTAVSQEGVMMGSVSTKERQTMSTWDRITARAGWAVLIIFTALSSYLNARRVLIGDHTAATELIVFHAAIPAVLLIAGLFAELVSMSTVHRAAKAVTVTGLVLVFAVTLIASYLAILDVVTAWNPHAPQWVNRGLAGVPDVVMVMAGSVVLSLRVRRHGLAPAVKTPAKSSTRGRFQRLADAAAARAEAALAVPPSPQAAPAVEPPRTLTEGLAEGVTEAPSPSTNTTSPSSAKAPAPSVDTPAKSAVEATPATVDAELEPFMEAAQRMVTEGVIARKAPVEIARVIAAIDAGASDNAVKASGIASASTAAKVRAALADTKQQQLVAV
ncbi:hypothetical protein [Mycobacteroides abscessus]|uniref:hypothetical protein n=1 Tax=Mycobacteroides abscessus TaxID=36809 RepID=UPI0019D30764|nr:hypothetical protein [Mycobacteroides abscessus]MBN7457556.1 hypothetical protein [Mycobacteroides abscessus subsp. abscessus]